jgi:hypothetical protein
MDSEKRSGKSGAETDPQSPKKKPYTRARLTRYGEVRALTQAQTSFSSEGSSGTGQMKPGSDRAIKENIVRVGTHPLGIGLYLFDYKPEFQDLYGAGRRLGVMADEVVRVMPEAVSRHERGHQVVDYAMLGLV